jgi:hypothetical protein
MQGYRKNLEIATKRLSNTVFSTTGYYQTERFSKAISLSKSVIKAPKSEKNINS